MSAIKIWTTSDDHLLSLLAGDFINRNLYRIHLSNEPFDENEIQNIKEKVMKDYGLKTENDCDYLVFSGSISNNTYSLDDDKINILYNNNELKDITEASDMLNLSVLGKISRKFYLCYPKSVVK
jgi:hypothetical protein